MSVQVIYNELIGHVSDTCDRPIMYNAFTTMYTEVDAHAYWCPYYIYYTFNINNVKSVSSVQTGKLMCC